MIETIMETIIEPFIAFFLEITGNPYLEEMLGALVVLYLLVLLRRRRIKQKAEPSDDQADPDRMDPSPPYEMAAFYEEETGEHFHEADAETIDEEDDIDDDAYAYDRNEQQWERMDGSGEARPFIETVGAPIDASAPPAEALVQKPAPLPAAPTPGGLFERLKSGLSKTRQNFSRRFEGILSGNRALDDDMMEEIEEALITADVGVPTTMELMKRISAQAHGITDADSFKTHLKNEMLSFVNLAPSISIAAKPYVIMMVGVNGAGKTTTIGKLASRYATEGKKVLLAAADTFRAAAADQLSIWAQRANADIVKHRDNADPAAVAYDGVEAALARGVDVVIVDTAGRLQTKVNLMEQLKKIKRSIDKALPGAPHEVMLVLDATTGQNAVSQARLFDEGIGVTGIILAKLDGTAKGGIIISICHTLKIPIRYIGIGESIDDLQAFDPERFIDALL
jgi:fused signal recognition particle receptor